MYTRVCTTGINYRDVLPGCTTRMYYQDVLPGCTIGYLILLQGTPTGIINNVNYNKKMIGNFEIRRLGTCQQIRVYNHDLEKYAIRI